MSILSIFQAASGIGLIVLILLQERSGGTSGIFGGGEGGGGFYQTRRGIEKTIFISTLILLGIFVILSLANLLR